MASSVEVLNAALANVRQQILDLSTTPPVNYSLDGQSESVADAMERLLKMEEQLVAAVIRAEGPTELHVTGLT